MQFLNEQNIFVVSYTFVNDILLIKNQTSNKITPIDYDYSK
jgi:hypothetical protein